MSEAPILITAAPNAPWAERLAGSDYEYRLARRADEIPNERWQTVEVLYAFGALPRPEQAPRLRWVQLHSAGVDHVLAHPLFASDVAFTTTSGIHAVSIGEYVLAMILAWRHRLPALFDQQRRREWPPDDQRWPLFVPDELAGQTIGLAGYGSIGRQVARLAHAFGMRVLALQQHAGRAQRGFILPGTGDPEGSLPERFFAPGELHALLAASDAVVIALPLTPATTRLFDAAAFAAMKPGALLVNIARGAIVDEEALVAALRSGPLGGAALDVFAHEPLPAGHPLWSLPNVLLSPHISGMTPHYDARASLVFAENLRRYRAGEPLLNLVDKAAGY